MKTPNPKKTIALVSSFPPGGASLNEYGYHLAINFAKEPDVEKLVVIADLLAEEAEELMLDPKIEVIRLWRFNSLFSMPRILWKLIAIRPDLALYNLQTASFGDRELPAALGLSTPLVSRIFAVKSGIIAHNMVSGVDLEDTVLKGQKLRQAIVRFGARVIDWVMLHANYITFTLESYTADYRARFPKSAVYYVPHGSFDTKARALPPYEKRAKKIVTMGKFGTYKRLETLINAFEIVRSHALGKDAELIIGGSDHPNCAGYMDALQVANAHKDYVKFHGYVAEEDVAGFFSQAKISVFDYSSTTGSSGVLHQAASYGAVPVFPAIGDFVDVCRNEGLAGESYETNCAEDMARAILQLLEDRDKANALAESNRQAACDMPFRDVIGFHVAKIDDSPVFS